MDNSNAERDGSEQNFLEVLYRDLALALGEAVWAFARIERRTYQYMRRHSADHVDELVGEVAFRARCSILRRLAERRARDSQTKQRALDAIYRIEKLAEQRNIIVHNPWSIWIDLSTSELVTEIQKQSNSGSRVNLGAIKRFAAEAEAAESELKAALDVL